MLYFEEIRSNHEEKLANIWRQLGSSVKSLAGTICARRAGIDRTA